MTARCSADHELALSAFDLASDQWAMRQDVHCFNDFADALLRFRSHPELGQVIKETIEIIEDPGRKLDSRHASGQGRSFRADGLRARPATRALR
jgi:hypothetical protein